MKLVKVDVRDDLFRVAWDKLLHDISQENWKRVYICTFVRIFGIVYSFGAEINLGVYQK